MAAVSIHAPRAGRDLTFPVRRGKTPSFNPRAPRGTRLQGTTRGHPDQHVSIHAPRAGRDWTTNPISDVLHVSIHAPRAGRDPAGPFVDRAEDEFQSTRPARDATCRLMLPTLSPHCFNPRAPRGTRPSGPTLMTTALCFNPRAPRGTRRGGGWYYSAAARVSIHAPRAGRDCRQIARTESTKVVSIHAPRAGRDQRQGTAFREPVKFQSTRPARDATQRPPPQRA